VARGRDILGVIRFNRRGPLLAAGSVRQSAISVDRDESVDLLINRYLGVEMEVGRFRVLIQELVISLTGGLLGSSIGHRFLGNGDLLGLREEQLGAGLSHLLVHLGCHRGP
jgi:hypothetical protein